MNYKIKKQYEEMQINIGIYILSIWNLKFHDVFNLMIFLFSDRFLHFTIASENIIIDANENAKLIDLDVENTSGMFQSNGDTKEVLDDFANFGIGEFFLFQKRSNKLFTKLYGNCKEWNRTLKTDCVKSLSLSQ